MLAIKGDDTTIKSTSSIATTEKVPIATVKTSPPVKEPTAAPSAEGTESTAPSIPDEEEGNFIPITDIQDSQAPSAAPTLVKDVSSTSATVSASEPVDITESEVVVEESSSFIRTLLFIMIFFMVILLVYRRYIMKYFDRRIPYGTALYSQVSNNER